MTTTEPYPTLRRAALGTGATFALGGAIMGTWAARVPAIRDQVNASPAQLGRALLAFGIGSVLVMPLTGRLHARLGGRRLIAGAAVVATGALAATAYAPNVLVLSALLVLLGAGVGAWDVSMNVHGHVVEARAGKAWMPRYHAMWSVGGMLAAGVAALVALLGVGVRAHFIGMAVVALVLLAVALSTFVDDRPTAAGGTAEERSAATPGGASRARLLTPTLIAIGAVTFCAAVTEGAANDWLALLLSDERGAGAGPAAAGYMAFAFAMFAARLMGTTLIEWRGRAAAVRLAGCVSAVGLLVLLTVTALPFAYIGALLWGLGVAIVWPATISAAGDLPGRSAEAIAVCSTVGYTAILLAPPGIGFLADHVGLGNALWVVLAASAATFLLAPATRERSRKDEPAEAYAPQTPPQVG